MAATIILYIVCGYQHSGCSVAATIILDEMGNKQYSGCILVATSILDVVWGYHHYGCGVGGNQYSGCDLGLPVFWMLCGATSILWGLLASLTDDRPRLEPGYGGKGPRTN